MVVKKNMIPFHQYITELFDRPYPVSEYKRLGSGIATMEITYHATVDGQDLVIDITNIAKGWEINFTLDGSHELTRAGKPYRILATVIAAVKLFLKWHTEAWGELPKQFDMVSKTSEGKRDVVYSALMRRFGKEYGYKIVDRYTSKRGFRPEDQRTVTTARLVEAVAVPVRIARKPLRVFDFDDTLAHTNAVVDVMRGGIRVSSLNSMGFRDYILQPGESYDFSAANEVIDPRPIGAMLKVLRQVLSQGKDTVILTGRGNGAAVQRWLASIGIKIPVFTVGHAGATHESIAQRKRDWLEMAVEQGYNDIEFFDDNAKNIQYAKTLKSAFPHIRLRTRLVKYKSKQGVREERDYKAEYAKMYGGDTPTPKQRRAMKKKTARKRVLRRMGREGRSNDGKEIDHKNGNALDSRPSNLRLVSVHTNRSKDNNKWRK